MIGSMVAGRDYVIVPFDFDDHSAFVFDSFRQSLQGYWPWNQMSSRHLVDDLKRTLPRPGTRALVAVAADDPDNYLGWVVALPSLNEIVFAFTKFSLRRYGIGSTLCLASGVDLTRPTAIGFWTRAAERINRRDGYQLFFRVTADETEEREAA